MNNKRITLITEKFFEKGNPYEINVDSYVSLEKLTKENNIKYQEVLFGIFIHAVHKYVDLQNKYIYKDGNKHIDTQSKINDAVETLKEDALMFIDKQKHRIWFDANKPLDFQSRDVAPIKQIFPYVIQYVALKQGYEFVDSYGFVDFDAVFNNNGNLFNQKIKKNYSNNLNDSKKSLDRVSEAYMINTIAQSKYFSPEGYIPEHLKESEYKL